MSLTATEFHAEIVEDFNRKYYDSPDFIERKKVWEALLSKHIKSGATVLDAGCGPGVFSFYLAEQGCEVTSFDGAEAMIEFCKKNKQAKNIPNINFHHAYLPLSKTVLNHQFDHIISSSVLEYVDEMDTAISSLGSRLKKDGLIFISLPNKQSFYKVIERLSYKMIGRPVYLRHSINTVRMEDLDTLMKKMGYEIVEHQFYSGKNLPARVLRFFLPDSLSCNLFISIYRKK